MAALMAAADAMLKAAPVVVCGRHGVGSGWVTLIVSGQVEAAATAVRAAQEAVAGHGQLIRCQVIARPDAPTMERMPHAAARGAAGSGVRRALGVLETQGLAPLAVGADAMVKAAAVELAGWAFVGGALCHACILGDVAAVQTAVLAGADAAASVGQAYDHLVLAQPDPGVAALLPPACPAASAAAPALGIVETIGYVATVAGADAMLKAAAVDIARLSIGSGGRSVVFVRGALDAVTAAVRAAAERVPATGQLEAARVVSRPDAQTLACFATPAAAAVAREAAAEAAMGLIETRSTVALVTAMDAMLKAAPVRYEGSYKVGYFLTASVVRGSVGAVRSALDAGAAAAARHGEVVAVHLIPRPYAAMERALSHR